ncbi:high mobility group B protein 15 isoform X2 [Humulus lupulus]|uniref:high mobility group B protein 15 isoform X2 n=1 Tax=Humulus lupulus TaxID=3486 RepID=UPI002B411B22|nr:high mobility group B protein 15 isoform X2 [Humulus lupulus]
MASTSSGNKTPLAVTLREGATANIIRYEDVAADPKLFMDTLEKLHSSNGTKFMIPIIGGKELDLHKLFLEVTSRGGIEKISNDRRWKEVTAVFNFPSTATNASYVLRKYYNSLLRNYELTYYFKAKSTPLSGAQQAESQSPSFQTPMFQQAHTSEAEFSEARTPASSASSTVIGVIDGKFESGYLVSVVIGSKRLKGVLYEAPHNPPSRQIPQGINQPTPNKTDDAESVVPVVRRRRRRKKCEIKRRDPAHPKPNRSGYNFFFAEQHARLKPLHPGKDREISRMIGESWNKLKESDKAVYQEKAVKDKERYRREMEGYRERLRTGQVISHAVPLQQRFPEPHTTATTTTTTATVEVNPNVDETEGGDSQTLGNESCSSKSDSEVDVMVEKDSDIEEYQEIVMDTHSNIVGIQKITEGDELKKKSLPEQNVGDEGVEKEAAEVRDLNFVIKEKEI